MNSYDHIRKIVQEEGRTARNLVLYNVPVRQNTGRGRLKNYKLGNILLCLVIQSGNLQMETLSQARSIVVQCQLTRSKTKCI